MPLHVPSEREICCHQSDVTFGSINEALDDSIKLQAIISEIPAPQIAYFRMSIRFPTTSELSGTRLA